MKRGETVAHIESQLDQWSTQLDELVVGYLQAGAMPNDPHRVRIDALRDRQESLQARFDAFNNLAGTGGPLGSFRNSISEDWDAMELGLKDLTR